MGQKVNPIAFRSGINLTTKIRCYLSNKDYLKKTMMYINIYDYVIDFFSKSVVSDVIIKKTLEEVSLSLISPKPGVIIAKKGVKLEELKNLLVKKFKINFHIGIIEVRKPELDVNYVANDIAKQIEKRASFKRVMNRAVMMAMKSGAKGIKVQLSGRLNGAEIARSEKVHKGALLLHTIKADINYAQSEAYTSYGVIGIKVWIYLNDIYSYDPYKYDRRLSVINNKGGRNVIS